MNDDPAEWRKMGDQLLEAGVKLHDLARSEERARRYEYIAQTIRVNAQMNGATPGEIEEMLVGKIDFISWIADKVNSKIKEGRQ